MRRVSGRIRGARGTNTYSLYDLLRKQPKGLSKMPGYPEMVERLDSSKRLRSLRISRRCFLLLHSGTFMQENLPNLYRTYRLPSDPFFPLFLSAKAAYLADRRRIRAERQMYIREQMRKLPPEVRSFMKYLGYLERWHNLAGKSPLWEKKLYPTSKRQVERYLRKGTAEWLQLFRDHLGYLAEGYPTIDRPLIDRLLSGFLLGITPDRIPPQTPNPALLLRSFRRASLLHHPDRGGDSELFIEVRRARELLTTP